MALSVKNRLYQLSQLSHYLLGNVLFKFGMWRGASRRLSKFANRIRPDAKKLASAHLFARLAICHLKLGENEDAAGAYHSLRRVLDRASLPHEEDRKWLSLYGEALIQAVGSEERANSFVDQLNWDAVSAEVKWLFPIEHLSEHFGLPMTHEYQ